MLQLRFFGTPVVRLDDQPLPTLARSPLLTSLLAFLVTYRDQPHSRPVLAAMFWPDLPESRARQYLNTHLWRLRCALKSTCPVPYLLSDSQSVQFNAAAPFWLDVAEFEAAMAILRRTSEHRADLTPEALGALERAVELYRGDFLEGVYTNWCIGLREQFREQYLAALEMLTRAHQTRGQSDAALRAARQLTRADPLREEAHYQLIQLSIRLGRLAEARTHYRDYETLWHDELKLPPSARMQALIDEIEPVTTSPAGSSGRGIFGPDRERLQPLLTLWRSLPEPHSLKDRLRREQLGDQVAECSGQLGQALKARSANAQARDYLELAVGTLASLPASRERHERELALRRDLDQLYDLRAERQKQSRNLQRLAELLDQNDDASARCDLLARQAWLALQFEKYTESIGRAGELLELCRRLGKDREQEGSLALRLLGIAHDQIGDFTAALNTYQSALALDEDRGDALGVYYGLNNLGSVLNNLGRYSAALEHLNRAQALTPAGAPLYRRATVSGNIGIVLTKLGQLPAAADYLREAMSLIWQSGDRVRECWLGAKLADLYLRRGEGERALLTAWHYAQTAGELGTAWNRALLADLLALIHTALGDGGAALTWADEAISVAQAHGLWRYQLRGRLRRAQALLDRRQFEAAYEEAQNALRLFREREQPLEERPELFMTLAECAHCVAETAVSTHAHRQAHSALQEIAAAIVEAEWRAGFLRSQPVCALCCAERSRLER